MRAGQYREGKMPLPQIPDILSSYIMYSGESAPLGALSPMIPLYPFLLSHKFSTWDNVEADWSINLKGRSATSPFHHVIFSLRMGRKHHLVLFSQGYRDNNSRADWCEIVIPKRRSSRSWTRVIYQLITLIVHSVYIFCGWPLQMQT